MLNYIERREHGEIMQPAAAEAMAVQAAGQPEPKNELERIVREELQKSLEERKAAALAAVARANTELREAEVEAMRSAGPPRPMPSLEREELEGLSVAQLPR